MDETRLEKKLSPVVYVIICYSFIAVRLTFAKTFHHNDIATGYRYKQTLFHSDILLQELFKINLVRFIFN